jgi:hypothetical protein
MDTQKITFLANKVWLSKESKSVPRPIIRTIPEWFRKADRFSKTNSNGDFDIGPDGGKIPTWKACPAIFDIMGTGYSLNTPCDIEFFNEGGSLKFKIANAKYSDFIHDRSPMPQFEHPRGHHLNHFAWTCDWQVKLPEGYSALYSQPFNRYELPFLTTSGIIDNDKVHLPGSLPFFIIEGFEGIIPAGTPYAQVIPFKRENWISEIVEQNDAIELFRQTTENANKYRKPDGGIYKNEVWEQRKYE